jgi:hypothetical protein
MVASWQKPPPAIDKLASSTGYLSLTQFVQEMCMYCRNAVLILRCQAPAIDAYFLRIIMQHKFCRLVGSVSFVPTVMWAHA